MSFPSPSSAPEARKIVAHGETVGSRTPKNQSSGRSGRSWIEQIFFRPIRGLVRFGFLTHGFTVGYFRSPLRGLGLAFLFLTATAHSQTNTLTDAEIKGRALAQKILAQRPAENSTMTGVLRIRDGNGNRSEVPIICKTIVTISVADTNVTVPDWQTLYQVTLTNRTEYLHVFHPDSLTNFYSYSTNRSAAVPVVGDVSTPVIFPLFFNYLIFGPALMSPYAGSDFWLCDLGLEFFHWPQQKVLKKDIHRSCGCTVLESTNPDPGTNGYSRVVSWVDDDSLGIVEAYAYDKNGKQLKDFYPKDFKKINGQWQVQTLVMENVQTGSKSRIEFDLKK